MAVIGEGSATLVDWAKVRDPNGKVAVVVELLSESNEIIQDMLWIEGNLETGHRTSVRTGLPSVTWRMMNQGVTPSKSTSAQIDEGIGMLEAWSEVDRKLANLGGDVSGFRLQEAKAFVEAMNQEFSDTLFYGNSSTAPEEFTGFAPRYASLSANNGQNIVDGAGSGSDNSSIWLIVWGSNTVCGIFPKGSKAGLEHVDHGRKTIEVTAGIGGQRLYGYQESFHWDCGLAVKDWRYAVRGANIDISNLVAKSSAADLVDMMIKMMARVPNMSLGKPVFYMNRSVKQMLDIQRRDDILGSALQYNEVDGKILLHSEACLSNFVIL